MEYAKIILYAVTFIALLLIAIYSWFYNKEVKKTTHELRIPLPIISEKILLIITTISASLSRLVLIFLVVNAIQFFF